METKNELECKEMNFVFKNEEVCVWWRVVVRVSEVVGVGEWTR